ncbi:hypothetical protein OAO87_03400, partial [bacterium]|nr:hypothetical protein [bacterium]
AAATEASVASVAAEAAETRGASVVTPGGREGHGEGGRSVLAINWFYEPFYQRIFPNRSFDLSPHYLLLEQQQPLDAPFPPAEPSAERAEAATPGRRAAATQPQFYARLARRRGVEQTCAESSNRAERTDATLAQTS